MRSFCTLFDAGYLLKGVAMLESLRRHCPGARVFVLCMDERTRVILERLSLPGVTLIRLSELETTELLAAKADRGQAEYCWTLSPCLPWYVLQEHPELDEITYVDADLYFFSSPDPVFAEIGSAPIAITEHRFIPRLRAREIMGRFCVQWVGFRRTEEGMACLSRWRDQCIEWCYYRHEGGRMGDQKYLDEWPARYPGCHIIQYRGAAIAPWNFANYEFGMAANGCPTVDGVPLVFYHFHQFQLLSNGRFDRLSSFYTVERREPEPVYLLYEQALHAAMARVRAVEPGFSDGLLPPVRVASRRLAQRVMPRVLREVAHRLFGY